MTKRIHSRTFYEALVEAGIVQRDDCIRRLVIDIGVDSAVVMYIERYGDERLLHIVHDLDGLRIDVATLPEGAVGEHDSAAAG